MKMIKNYLRKFLGLPEMEALIEGEFVRIEQKRRNLEAVVKINILNKLPQIQLELTDDISNTHNNLFDMIQAKHDDIIALLVERDKVIEKEIDQLRSIPSIRKALAQLATKEETSSESEDSTYSAKSESNPA